MKKLILIAGFTCIVMSAICQKQKPILNGVWEWDATAMQGKPMIGKFFAISDQDGKNNNGYGRLTMTPQEVKDAYPNWIAGTRDASRAYYTSDGYYYITVGGYTNRNARGEVIATGEYIVSFTKVKDAPDHIMNGTLILRSWNKINSGTVQNRGGQQVLLSGQWINKKLEPKEKQLVVVDYLSKFKTPSFKIEDPLNIDLPPAKLIWKANFTLKDIEFETLTVDSEAKPLKSQSGLDEMFKNKAEYRGNFQINLLVPVNGKDVQRWSSGKVFEYDYSKPPRYLLIGLKELVRSRENYSKVFGVAQAEFNTIKLRIVGNLAEIDGSFEANSDYSSLQYRPMQPPAILLNNTGTPIVFKEVLLRDLHYGDNYIDITKNGKTFRLHFTIE